MPKYKILLVDYDPRSIKQCKEILSHLDCTVEVALDGVVALNLFPQVKPDLVIVEAMLPKKHGFDVCHEIKKSPQGKDTPVIIMTQFYKGRKYRDQAFHIYHCDEYIEKPCTDQLMLETVKKCLSSAKESQGEVEEEKLSIEMEAGTKKKASLSDEKLFIESGELEKEISSKVDEVLTMFSGTMQQSAVKEERKSSAKAKRRIKKSKKEVKAKTKSKAVKPIAAEVKKAREEEKLQPVKVALLEEEKAKEEKGLTFKEEPMRQEEGLLPSEKEDAGLEQPVQRKDDKVKEEKIEEEPFEELVADIRDEVATTSVQGGKYFNSSMIIIFASISFLGIILLLLPIFKGKEEKRRPVQSGISLTQETQKREMNPAPPTDAIPFGPPSAVSPQDAIGTSIKESSMPLQTDMQDRQPHITIIEPRIEMKPMEKIIVKKEAIELPGPKKPAVAQEEREKIQRPSGPEMKKPAGSIQKAPPSMERKTYPPLKEGPKEPAPTQNVTKDSPQKTRTLSRTEEKENIPAPSPIEASEKQRPPVIIKSEDESKEPPSMKIEKTLTVEKDLLPEEPALKEKIEEPSKLPEPEPIEKPQGISEKEKYVIPVQKLLEQLPPIKDTPKPPAPKEGQIVDYSLLDREPQYLAHDRPKYPLRARLKGIEGEVRVRVLIAQTGYVEKVEVIKGLEEHIDQAAIEAVRKWVYRPPLCQGVRVKTWKEEVLTFPPKSNK